MRQLRFHSKKHRSQFLSNITLSGRSLLPSHHLVPSCDHPALLAKLDWRACLCADHSFNRNVCKDLLRAKAHFDGVECLWVAGRHYKLHCPAAVFGVDQVDAPDQGPAPAVVPPIAIYLQPGQWCTSGGGVSSSVQVQHADNEYGMPTRTHCAWCV